MFPDLLAATTPVVEAFEALGVPYHVGGSVASSIHGVPRSTLDVDLVADLGQEAVASFVERLRGDYYVDEEMIRDAIRRRASFNVIHLATMLKIDVFVLKDRPFEREAFRRRVVDTLDEGPDARRFFVATAEDTVLHKLTWFRDGDQVSERQWRDVLGVIRVAGDSLDWDYLRHWADQLEIRALLEQAREEAGPG